jgi:glutathione S-transferase
MQGQANHFSRYAPEHIQYGIDRYKNETRRLYGVLNKHLKDGNREYLVGNKCTIADISHYGWIEAAFWPGIEIDEFPELKAWEARMLARPGVAKGRDVPEPSKLRGMSKEEREESAAKSRAWIQQAMKEDAKT